MMDAPTIAEVLAETRGGAVVVSTMSVMAFADQVSDLDFRVLGLMGAAASIGLGIAVGKPDQDVWVVDGDGSLLMQLGVLAAVVDAAPPRFVHIVVDNGIYAVSGAQPLPGHRDWAKLAEGAGYRACTTCASAEGFRVALLAGEPGPRMVIAQCSAERPNYPVGAFAFDAGGEADRLRRRLASSA